MELVERGELIGDVTRCEPFSGDRARRYFRDVLCGLAYLHCNGVIHCDLKPQNLFVTADDRIKIADFGSATFDEVTGCTAANTAANSGGGGGGGGDDFDLDGGGDGGPCGRTRSRTTGSLGEAEVGGRDGGGAEAGRPAAAAQGNMAAQAALGTPLFMAPELFRVSSGDARSKGPASVQPSVDIWSLGATLFMMVCGRPPWMGRNELELSHKIQHLDLVFPAALDLCPHLRALVRKMLVKEPADRIELADIIDAEWVTLVREPARARAALEPLAPRPAACAVAARKTSQPRNQASGYGCLLTRLHARHGRECAEVPLVAPSWPQHLILAASFFCRHVRGSWGWGSRRGPTC